MSHVKEYTTSTDRFTKCFDSDEKFHVQFKKWQRLLQKALHTNFRKNRMKEKDKKKSTKLDDLISRKTEIMKKKYHDSNDVELIEIIENEISMECKEREWQKLNRILGDLEDGDTNTNIWKEMKKAFPTKVKPLPTGVRNIENKVITNPDEKKVVILEHFKHRMRERPVKQEVEDIIHVKKNLFENRLKLAKGVRSPAFTLNELENTLKNLKSGNSRDPEHLITDIFKEDAMGDNLKLSVLIIMNKMKDETSIPDCVRTANKTMLHKKKDKLDLKNWRGIFVTSVLRTILMKLIHERAYEKVAPNMTDSQIGAVRKKSVRNHIFILNSIISDVLSSNKKAPIDLTIMDVSQIFDSEDVSICLNALYEAEVKDDTFALIYEANRTNFIAVKAPNGLT